jgi:hypothetical protein
MKPCTYPDCQCNIVYTGAGRPPPSRCPTLRKYLSDDKLKDVDDMTAQLENASPAVRDEFIAANLLTTIFHHRDAEQRLDMILTVLRWYRAAFVVEVLNATLEQCKKAHDKNPAEATFETVCLIGVDTLGREMCSEANKKSDIISNLLDLMHRPKKGDKPTLPPSFPYRATSERN